MKKNLFCLMMLSLCLWLTGCGDENGDDNGLFLDPALFIQAAPPLVPVPVQLSSGFGGRLLIGDPPLEYPYDARGKTSRGMMGLNCAELGMAPEVCAELGPLAPCQAYLYFKEEDLEAAHMYVIAEWIPIYIEIQPKDMVGIIDFSDPDNVEVNLGLDSIFQPVIFGVKPPGQGLSVVTTQTTGTAGDFSGEPMDRKGDFFFVSVALVPKTGDIISDTVLGLPTEAVSLLPAHMDFPLGRYYLCEDPPTSEIATIEMEVLKEGRLSIDFLGQYTTFPYDGKGSNSVTDITALYQDTQTGDDIADVSFADFEIPILQFIPGLDIMGVRIENAALEGSINFNSGEMNLFFDAQFTPFILDYTMPSMSVITPVTTETQDFHHHDFDPLQGIRLSKWGNAKLVGIADMPALPEDTLEGIMINLMLGLPNDAVCELPVHLDFLGGNMPAGWPPPDPE